MSITRPPSTRLEPATLWPPPRTAISRFCARPCAIASLTSAAEAHWAMIAGRRSIIALKIVRASS
jgi:hypothetical protein